MSDFRIQVDDWVQVADPDPRRAFTAAELMILVDDVAVTRLHDDWSKTVTDRARVPLYPLAEWFAANWWRIHYEAPYESAGPPPLDWRLSHDLTGVGGGIVWPRMRFASDDRTIQISARAAGNAPWEPVRHLNDVRPARPVLVADFDHAVDELMRIVLRRLDDVGVSAEPLATIWADVLAERSDPEVAEWRRWEARLGYDPDMAPDHLVERMGGLSETAGRSAAAEIAPLLGPGAPMTIELLNDLANASGLEATPIRGSSIPSIPSELFPWARGQWLAHEVRSLIGIRSGPLSDSALNELLGVKKDVFEHLPLPRRDVAIGLGVRDAGGAGTRLHFRKRHPAGLRFEAARFIADNLSASDNDLWLPLTDRATARQKLQRAFAAEFLAPIDEIKDQVGDVRTSDRLEEVGDRYGVSPLAIRSQMANHGFLTSDDA